MKFDEKEVRIQWYSGTGAGGQYRNKHQNSCRLVHSPTGIQAIGTKNRERAPNLRDAMTALERPASDFPGCFYDSARDAWQARIQRDGKKYFLGRHATKQKASEEYSAASSIWFEQQ